MYQVRQGPFRPIHRAPRPRIIEVLEAGVINYSLTANGLDLGAPVLGSPALSQNHVLSASGLDAGAPVLGSPALQQNHVLAALGLDIGAPELGTPTLTESVNYALEALGLTIGAPELGQPALSQNHVLEALGLTIGTPELGSPVMAQVHILTADAILIGAPELGSPTLTIVYRISGVTRDGSGNPLGSCVVQLFRTSDDAILEEKTSGVDGSFYFDVADMVTQHYIVAYKAGSPDRAGTTLNTLVGV